MKKEKKIKDNELDCLWSLKIHAGGRCEVCGGVGRLNAHHVFSRSNKSVRWDLDNGVLLCVSHHVFGQWSAHKNPVEFIEKMRTLRGEKWYKALREKAKKSVQADQLFRKKIKILLENYDQCT